MFPILKWCLRTRAFTREITARRCVWSVNALPLLLHNRRWGKSFKSKACPVIRNGLARAELFEHAPFGESQRFWSGLLATQFRIENLHQIKSAVIVNCPKSRYDGTSASQEESTSERGNPLFTLDRSNG